MILGIDLGTTNSAACVWESDQYKLIPNVHGRYLTPSVVSIDKSGQVLVGDAAKSRLISHPENTASQFKRAMGTEQTFVLGKRSFNAVELSSIILGKLKADAEAYLSVTINRVVISVPAYFNDQQRKATVSAAEFAGLHVERLINEPTAAAIAYGLNDKQDDVKYLVLDLGGGTFDVSLLEFFDNVMEVHATAGDNRLGGEDFTQVLVDDVISQFELSGISKQQHQILYSKMEQMKCQLSHQESCSLSFTLGNKSIEVSHSRDTFRQLTSKLLKRILRPVERVMKDTQLISTDIDKVILVGGASRMPSYRKAVSNMLKQLPHSHLDPDLIIAIGAGIQAGLKADATMLKEVVLTDVAPFSLGVEVYNQNDIRDKVGGYFDPIIERNTTVPVSRTKDYFTVEDNQKELIVKVYQGESRYARNNLYLGQLHFPIPKNKAGAEPIEVRFSYDMSGLLDVDIHLVNSGKRFNQVFAQNNQDMTEKEKKATLRKLEQLKFHPRDSEVNKTLIARLEACYEMSLGDNRDFVGGLLNQWESALATQNLIKIDSVSISINKQLEALDNKSW
jgi:molecular chaperone HscC